MQSGKTIEVKAHRVLKNTFPGLNLYVHYSGKYVEGKSKIKRYSISSENGIAAFPYSYFYLEELIQDVKKGVLQFGIDYCKEKDKEVMKHFEEICKKRRKKN